MRKFVISSLSAAVVFVVVIVVMIVIALSDHDSVAQLPGPWNTEKLVTACNASTKEIWLVQFSEADKPPLTRNLSLCGGSRAS